MVATVNIIPPPIFSHLNTPFRVVLIIWLAKKPISVRQLEVTDGVKLAFRTSCNSKQSNPCFLDIAFLHSVENVLIVFCTGWYRQVTSTTKAL